MNKSHCQNLIRIVHHDFLLHLLNHWVLLIVMACRIWEHDVVSTFLVLIPKVKKLFMRCDHFFLKVKGINWETFIYFFSYKAACNKMLCMCSCNKVTAVLPAFRSTLTTPDKWAPSTSYKSFWLSPNSKMQATSIKNTFNPMKQHYFVESKGL